MPRRDSNKPPAEPVVKPHSCDYSEDADTVLKYRKNLSMYVLYGVFAIAQNNNVENHLKKCECRYFHLK